MLYLPALTFSELQEYANRDRGAAILLSHKRLEQDITHAHRDYDKRLYNINRNYEDAIWSIMDKMKDRDKRWQEWCKSRRH